MRIVAGRHRGRTLLVPEGRSLRPTADRVREAVFNILAHGIDGFDFEGIAVIDVFAGTGALGLEAMSRGAAHVTFIDHDHEALNCARKNAAQVGEWRNATLLRLDATRLPPPPLAAKAPCALAFLDPPYGEGLAIPALQGLAAKGWLAKDGIAVVEIGAKEDLEPPRGYALLDRRTYGAAQVLFLKFEGLA